MGNSQHTLSREVNDNDNTEAPYEMNENKNYSSVLHDFITKNDALNLIWKLEIPKNEILQNNSTKIFTESFYQ